MSSFRVYPFSRPRGAAIVGAWLCWAAVGASASQPWTSRLQEGEDDAATPDLVEVFQCRFGPQWDVNYDGWPDRWSRTVADGFPSYVRMEILDSDVPAFGRRLAIFPDGASARASSPPIGVMPKFSYSLSLRMKVEGVEHGQAFVRMEFQNPSGEPLQNARFGPIAATGEWIDIAMPPQQPQHDEIDRLVVHFDFKRGVRGDLPAVVSVADLRLGRAPSIQIQTDSAFSVYSSAEDVKVTCRLSGILERNPTIRFQLLDAANKRIGAEGTLELDGQLIDQSAMRASDIVDGFGSDSQQSYEGSIDWRPPIPDYGFYRIRAQMISSETNRVMDEPTISIAVVRPGLIAGGGGEFGWSLPNADRPLPFSVLQELLPLAGVHKVKCPVWFAPGDDHRGDEFLRFADQLKARGIETVGVLEDPSLRLDNPFTTAPPPPVEGLLAADSSHWMPLIDHVITKLALRIRWWQFGRDGDTSFVGYRGLIDKIFDIRNIMFRFGQDVRVGLGWRWDHVREWDRPITWDFEQLSGRESADASSLDGHLAKAPPTTAKRWVLVAPPENLEVTSEGAGLATDILRHETRVRDFVEQIIVAKVHKADGIVIADPFSGEADPAAGKYGVMNADGTPGELLLPWRTCARLLGGARHIGSVNLPSGSRNWIFKRHDGLVVMVLWNVEPVQESLYLGDDVSVVDIWGKVRDVEETEGRQVIHANRMPRFVIGLNESVARWRMATRFERTRLPSVFGAPQANALHVVNTFEQGAGGTAEILVPTLSEDGSVMDNPTWRLMPSDMRLSLAKGEETMLPFEVRLEEADHGRHRIRIDFVVKPDREYRFSVWRDLRVGMGELSLDIASSVDADGRLHVTQLMRNTSDTQSDFRCMLYARGHRRKRAHVFHLGAKPDKKTYTYLNGRGLVGKELKLRVEEVDGRRVLIHRFVVEPGAPAEHVQLDADPSEQLASDG